MEINIVWLYPDILNLHGDRGNVMALLKIGEAMELPVNLIKVNNADELPDLEAVDLIVMGAGQLRDIDYVKNDMLKYEEKLRAYVEQDGYILITGSTGCIFGSKYYLEDGKEAAGLGIFDMEARALNRTKMPMLTKEVYGDDIYWKTEDGMEIIGCQIQRMDFKLGGSTTPLGRLVYGYGNNCRDDKEGARYKNVLFTNTVGPLLSGNPWFGIKILKEAAARKGLETAEPDEQKLDYLKMAKNSFALKKAFIKDKKKLPGIINNIAY